MVSYHILGSIAAMTFMLTVYGLWCQLALVNLRKKLHAKNQLISERPTDILSLNQLNSVFFACYAFYLYGIILNPINHYLAWPRFIALIILIGLFYQVLIDRKTWISKIVFSCAILMFFLSGFIFLIKHDVDNIGKGFSQVLIIISTLVLAQGYLHQILLIRKTGKTGAVSIRFHQCVLLTAISTVAFGFAIGYTDGWPLILLASVSATMKIITLWHFRWVRVSAVAKKIRETDPKNNSKPNR